jgi:hypothetical protein
LILCALAVVSAVQSCASFGPSRVAAPCDERFEALFPAIRTGEGIEIVGRLRMEIEQYRVRGILRITYSPRERAVRMDFRQSSLFGAIEEDVTMLAGDSLVIYDREHGRYWGNDSSLSLVEGEVGERITSADILDALLFAFPRCAELGSAAVEYSGSVWRLRAIWRDHEIEMRGERGRGIRELRKCFTRGGHCYSIEYGHQVTSGDVGYPAWVKLSRESGDGGAFFELTGLKEVTASTSLYEDGSAERP